MASGPEIAQEQQPKWQGKARAELSSFKAEQVWPLFEDFFGLNKWLPNLTTCVQVEGIPGHVQPGSVRYNAGPKIPFDSKINDEENWATEKLVFIDPKEMVLSYSVVDGNIGFNSYLATVRVMPKDLGCVVEWSYEVEPVTGLTPEGLESYIASTLQVMVQRMAEALQV